MSIVASLHDDSQQIAIAVVVDGGDGVLLLLLLSLFCLLFAVRTLLGFSILSVNSPHEGRTPFFADSMLSLPLRRLPSRLNAEFGTWLLKTIADRNSLSGEVAAAAILESFQSLLT